MIYKSHITIEIISASGNVDPHVGCPLGSIQHYIAHSLGVSGTTWVVIKSIKELIPEEKEVKND